MSKAKEAALKAYPKKMGMFYEPDIHYEADLNKAARIKYIEGYEQAEQDLGWISVKDKLPGPSEWVLACIEDNGVAQCLTLAVYNENTKEWHTDEWEDGVQERCYPDYWMPIPDKIPNEKEK